MTVSTYATPDVIPDMTTLPEAPVSPAPIASEHAEMWALIQRAQAGDREAFGQIWQSYADPVFRFIYFRCGNRPLAEDLAGEVWLRALKRIGSFTYEGRDIGAWLVTIARNLVADHFKSGRYRLEVSAADIRDVDREERHVTLDGSWDHVVSRDLISAILDLNEEQRQVIILRFQKRYSVSETAAAMGKNEGAIKALQYRAVRSLARALPDHYADYLKG